MVLSALVAEDYLRQRRIEGAEVYGLFLMAASGAVVMAAATDLIVLFLGLESLSIALYVMAGSDLRRLQSQESAMKYFVLGAFSSAFFLYGIALVYGATGTTNLGGIFSYLSTTVLLEDRMLLAGLALLLVGLGFKAARGALPLVDARRVPGRAHAGHRVLRLVRQGRRRSRRCCECSSRRSAPTSPTGSRP